MIFKTSRGFTLTELLVAMMIASVMMFAFVMPFVAERIFWKHGKQQTEAQRDAQSVMRAIARSAREASTVSFSPINGYPSVVLTKPCGTVTYERSSALSGAQLKKIDGCNGNSETLLIDGVRSKVQQFTADEFTATNPLLHLTLQVNHKDSGSELLETRVLLRNAS